MQRTATKDTIQYIGRTVRVEGWVQNRRDHGGLLFVDLRDHTGLVQIVFHPDQAEIFAAAGELRDEFVVKVEGRVIERETGLANDKLITGGIELQAETLTILNRCETMPIQPFSDQQSSEELRFRYRYLDLRRPKIQTMLKKRAEMYRIIRDYMDEREFTEIATPILANSSPEGARDFLIPSRLQEGKYYALPQAPQQFKQLLMVGGVHRYYQLAACFRDEDPRADRLYGEFYQLDLEMSFVEDGETVRSMTEPLIEKLVTEFADKKLFFAKTPRLTYGEAMERYGSDKPDLRYDMQLVELSDVFKDSDFSVFKNALDAGGAVKAIRVPGGASLSRKQIDDYTDIAKKEGAGGMAYIMYQDGEAKSPILKFMSETEQTAIKERTEAQDGDAVFFGADKRHTVNAVLGKLRSVLGDDFNLKDPNVVALAWIIDFPFYEINESTKKVDFGHNPFSMPKGGLDTLDVSTDEEKLSIVADQYDMVMNGYEICSGGVRNHNPDVLYKVFGLLGYHKTYVEEKFGAMLSAFKYGAPPHAGCAFGVDRILMELMNEPNVREVLAFPKNGSGVDVMMNSPSVPDPTQLKELSLK